MTYLLYLNRSLNKRRQRVCTTVVIFHFQAESFRKLVCLLRVLSSLLQLEIDNNKDPRDVLEAALVLGTLA